MADLQKLVDDLSALTVLEAAELSKLLEEKWGVSAAAAVAVAAPAGGGAGAAAAEEKTEFDVILTGDGGKKIWATEYGEPTSSVDEATQAAYLTDFLAKWRTLPYAGPAYVYTTRDRNTGSGNPDDTFGLYRTDWSPKPAQAAVAALA